MATDPDTLGAAFFDRLAFRYVDDPDHHAVLEVDVTDDILGPNGSVHAGIVMLVADVAGAKAIANATGRQGASAGVSIQLLAPVKVGPIRAVGHVVNESRNTATAQVTVLDVGNDARRVAVAIVNCTLFRPAEPTAGG